MCPHRNQSVPLLAPSQNGMSQKQKSVTHHIAGYSNVKVLPPELLASSVTCHNNIKTDNRQSSGNNNDTNTPTVPAHRRFSE